MERWDPGWACKDRVGAVDPGWAEGVQGAEGVDGVEGAEGGWDHVFSGSLGKMMLTAVLITKERVLMESISTQVSCFFC